MPALIIYGVPSAVGRKSLEGLSLGLRYDVSSLLRLSPDEVSVFFPADLLQEGLGEELICLVNGLFERPERTTELRQRLAEIVMSHLRGFSRLDLPQCQKVEAIVNRFNQDSDGFAMCDPRKTS